MRIVRPAAAVSEQGLEIGSWLMSNNVRLRRSEAAKTVPETAGGWRAAAVILEIFAPF
jgi:hypothetical protein